MHHAIKISLLDMFFNIPNGICDRCKFRNGISGANVKHKYNIAYSKIKPFKLPPTIFEYACFLDTTLIIFVMKQ